MRNLAFAVCLLLGSAFGCNSALDESSDDDSPGEDGDDQSGDKSDDPDSGGPACGGFSDVDSSDFFCKSVGAVKSAGLMTGCGNNRFCPDDPITRAQMASVLIRGMGVDSAGSYPCGLEDVTADNSHRHDICKLKELGITKVTQKYNPDSAVRRDEMASLLSRALELPSASCRFPDIVGNVHAGAICKLAAARITLGCNPPYNTAYCPESTATRGQMAVFVDRGFLHPPATNGCTPGFNLVWADNFDGSSLDSNRWTRLTSLSGINESLSANTTSAKNADVKNGKLLMTVREEDFAVGGKTYDFTTARLVSKNQGDWRYGYFEARIKRSPGLGIYASFWMLPTDNAYGGWPASGEIDIMESHGGSDQLSEIGGNLHYGEVGNRSSSGAKYKLSAGTFADDYHVFGLEWLPDRLRWYVDGELFNEETEWFSTGHPYPAPFDKRFHFVLTQIVGGHKGDPPAATTYPQTVTYDWIKAYEACGSDSW